LIKIFPKKFKSKLFFFFLFIISFILILSLLSFKFAFDFYDSIIYNESAKVLNLISSIIENELKRVENMSFLILSDPNIQKKLISIKDSPKGYSNYQAIEGIRQILSKHAFSEEYIISITLIDAKNNKISTGKNLWFGNEELEDILRNAQKYKGANLWIPPNPNDYALKSARIIRRIEGLKLDYLGLLVIRIDMKNLVNSATYIQRGPSINLQILSEDKNIFSIGKDVKLEKEEFFDLNKNYGIINIDKEKYFIAYMKSPYTDWIYVNIIPFESIYERVKILRNITIFVYFLIFILVSLLSLRFSNKITIPIEKLSLKMKRVEGGDFSIDDDINIESDIEEIKSLYKDFRIMIQKINNLIKENYLKQILINETRYKILQAQINPHFLYNTLDSIYWMAKMNKQKEISIMVDALGNLLRGSLDKRDIISIREEIEILKNYITIQKMRYGERLDFQMNIEEDILDYSIPKLSLQPIIENSINHVLEKIVGVCKIKLEGKKYEEKIIFSVEDNGKGIEENILEKIDKGEVKPKGFGIGLKNIDERIKMTFGDEFGIKIGKGTEGGARIEIIIPCEVYNV